MDELGAIRTALWRNSGVKGGDPLKSEALYDMHNSNKTHAKSEAGKKKGRDDRDSVRPRVADPRHEETVSERLGGKLDSMMKQRALKRRWARARARAGGLG